MSSQPGGIDLYGILQVDPRAHPSVIQAAYRALARQLHPDQTQTDVTAPAMAMLNRAYGVLRDPEQRKSYDDARARTAQTQRTPNTVAAGPGRGGPPPSRDRQGTRITFGRYQGWTLRQLARHDPDYLEWLKRHSSGIGYRREIEEVLAAQRPPQPAPAGSRRR